MPKRGETLRDLYKMVNVKALVVYLALKLLEVIKLLEVLKSMEILTIYKVIKNVYKLLKIEVLMELYNQVLSGTGELNLLKLILLTWSSRLVNPTWWTSTTATSRRVV